MTTMRQRRRRWQVATRQRALGLLDKTEAETMALSKRMQGVAFEKAARKMASHVPLDKGFGMFRQA